MRETEAATQLLRTFPDELLRSLVDSLSDFAVSMLTPDGIVASWNNGAVHITGYDASEAIGTDFSRFFPVSGETSAALLRKAAGTGRAEIEGWKSRKNGERYWALALLHPIRSPDGALIGFGGVIRDLTEKRAAQRALLDTERRFRLLVEGVTDYAIFMLDNNGIVTSWNAGAERLKGYKADEIVGQHFSKFYSSADRAQGLPARTLHAAGETGRFESEGWRIRKDGSRFWASVVMDAIRDSDGRLIGFGKVTRDISERRAAQEALRQSERQLRLLIDGVRDYAIFMLDPNGLISSWNSGAERIKGYAAQEVIGTHFSRFYVEDDRAAGIPARALATAERDGRVEMEGWRCRKDGSLFWANVVIDRVRDQSGKLVGFAKITRDITERKSAQLALEEAQARASQAQKMEALGHLTGGVAHDFNNLLMIISGQNMVLKRAAPDNPRATRAAEAVEATIQRAASLIRQLLTFSRRQTLSPRPIDLGQQIDAFKSMLTSTMGGLTILATVPPDTWPVIADSNELELALLNLAINARDAMPDGGSITITAENRRLSARAGDELDGEFVAISVADTGTGIAPDILPKIFDPFFTTKQPQKGSGLGLSQVHGFAHQSGGKVTIDSKLGEGTRITFYLPRASSLQAERGSDEKMLATGRGTVLLVDDNPEVGEATAAMLGELGYDVVSVASAEAALAHVATARPLLVLSDIVMPGGQDGLALARALRKSWPDLPIVLMTGYAKNAPTDGEFPLLRKPSNLGEIGRIIRSAAAAHAAPNDNVVPLRPPFEH